VSRLRAPRRLLRRVLVLGLVAAAVLTLVLRWRATPPPAPPLTSLLPRGSAITSQARVELDGRPPFEIAATVFIPTSPRAPADLAHALIAGYDRWRHRWRILLLSPLAGIPTSLEAGALLGRREAVVFPAYAADATVYYRVITLRWGRAVVLYAGQARGPVEVVRGVIAERDPRNPRGLRWDGRAFRAVPAPPPLPAALVWRYWTDRTGYPHAETNTVFLVPGQRLVPVRNGGGPAVVPIPDGRLDVLGAVFRPRQPGTYSLTIPDFAGRPGGSYRLTIEVEDGNP